MVDLLILAWLYLPTLHWRGITEHWNRIKDYRRYLEKLFHELINWGAHRENWKSQKVPNFHKDAAYCTKQIQRKCIDRNIQLSGSRIIKI